MTSVTALAEELERRVYLQRTIQEFTKPEYMLLIQYAIRMLFIDTLRALEYKNYEYTLGEVENEEDEPEEFFSCEFEIDEEEYILLVAEIQFLKIIQKDVNTITSYTTNAISVTGADKPYAHLADSIAQLELRRNELLLRMLRFTHSVSS